ncbi:diaminopimelate decarboxylase [Candidatus Vidania fulgoroideorum]
MKIENVDIKKIIENYKNPVNIYSKCKILKNLRLFNRYKKFVFFYALKANENKSILKIIRDNYFGFEAVSYGEIKRLLSLNVNPDKILFSGVGKSVFEIKKSLENKVRIFNVESIQEVERILGISTKLKVNSYVILRINLDIDCNSHPNIKTGVKFSKFGLNIEEAKLIKSLLKGKYFSKIIGIGFHLGSQILNSKYFIKAINKILIIKEKYFPNINVINIGGGIGVDYVNSKFNLNLRIKNKILKDINKLLLNRNEYFYIELGRSVIADTCVTLFKVEYIKRNYIITDLGMNNIIRPALYNSYHKILNLSKKRGVKKKVYNIVGPICECSDFLSKNILISAKQGDYLIIKDTGAYCYSMSSNYNMRNKADQVLIIKNKVKNI